MSMGIHFQRARVCERMCVCVEFFVCFLSLIFRETTLFLYPQPRGSGRINEHRVVLTRLLANALLDTPLKRATYKC